MKVKKIETHLFKTELFFLIGLPILIVFRDKVKLDCSVTHSSTDDTNGLALSAEGEEAEDDQTDISSFATAGSSIVACLRALQRTNSTKSQKISTEVFGEVPTVPSN
jgi:hypothetical protein